jgi:alpha 1,2-mannosyltransferase
MSSPAPDQVKPAKTLWQTNGVRKTDFCPDKQTITRIKSEWQEFAGRIPSYDNSCKGRGIVICGGGVKYFTCAWVNINLLRKNGCQLPIELWYSGEELTEEVMMALKPLGVDCRNVAEYTTAEVFKLAIKPFAILHSSFKEILFLDADNNCVRDPAFLFDSSEFHSCGAVFWPDFWTIDKQNPIWEITDVDDYVPIEQESGQILIDKEQYWRELNLCLFFNLNGKDYYQMLLGDKDTFKFAWLALGSRYHMIDTPVATCGYNEVTKTLFTRGVSMVQHDLQGDILFIHRNLVKWDITGDHERVWRTIKRFKSNGKRMFDHNVITVKDGIRYFGFDMEGDVETLDFKTFCGDLEPTCLEILKDLRQSDFYSSFLLHQYLVRARPGYSPFTS